MRESEDGFLGADDRARRVTARRKAKVARPRVEEDPARADGEWPLPFASFWTSGLAMLASLAAQSATIALVALVIGVGLGVPLDRWLRRHPSLGGSTLRFLLGVPPPRPRA